MAACSSLRAPVRRAARSHILAALLAGAATLATASALAAPPVSRTIHTSRPKFRIPFQFDSEEMARLGAVEIRLFVSTDRGKHWQHAQSVAPGEGRFTFEATGEGEFWFAVRTVDGVGQLHPPGPPQSGLQVVVDQTDPQLEIRVREPVPGEVELTWRAADENLDIDSLKLEFLDPGAVEWQTVAVTPAESGQTTWTVPTSGRVFVRASVADEAGNDATADASTGGGNPPAQPAAQPAGDRPDFNRPVAGPDPVDRNEQSLVLGEQPVVIPNGSADAFVPVTTRPAPAPTTTRAVAGPRQTPVVADAPESFRPETRAVAAAGATPTRYVRSRSFSVQYELDDVGPSGVANVDLYITENNGLKWFHYGPDEDRQSPVAINVPRDGSYGFTLRARSGAGLVDEPPQPGDEPTFVVVVDRQPPQARLGAITHQPNAGRGDVNVEWTVQDERLDDRPIRLSWAPAREGPWRPITDWIRNTGRHQWQVDEGALTSVLLRLEARDAAGNISRVDSTSPLLLDTAKPTARITDVETAIPMPPQ